MYDVSDASGISLRDDMLYGAAAIAKYLGIARRKVFYLLEQGRIPGGKLGREYVASRTALQAHFAKLACGTIGGGAEGGAMPKTTETGGPRR
jgi:excisionase family DNA binding protein